MNGKRDRGEHGPADKAGAPTPRQPPRRNDHAHEPEQAGAAGRRDAGEDTVDHGVVAGLEAEVASLKDRLLRALAEAENTRRRAEKDIGDARQYAIAKFAGDIVGVADNLARAVKAIPAQARKSEGLIKTLIDGVEMTERQLAQVLERHGIRKLDPVGERFDPNFHEALFTVPDPALPAGTVSTVVEPGYAIGSRPLRPAKVGVAATPQD